LKIQYQADNLAVFKKIKIGANLMDGNFSVLKIGKKVCY
jgi:hypothetical protein